MSGQDRGSSCATCQGEGIPVPIIFVPGIMGTRLTLAGGVNWDPDSKAGMIRWMTRRTSTVHDLLRHNSAGEVMTTDGAAKHGLNFSRAKARASRETYQRRLDRGWAGPSGDFYGPIMARMDATVYKEGYINPVFGGGYDWRQSNADSGDRIANKVSQVLSVTGADKAIIVTHSMGGIATRAGLKRNPGVAAKVAGVVHLAQPVLGAPVFYRRMLAGNTWGSDGVMKFIMGTDADTIQVGVGGVRGAFQLLPVDQYRDPCPGHDDWWLHYRTFEEPHVERAWNPTGDVWGMYQRPDSPPGIVSNTHGSPNIITPDEWGGRAMEYRGMVESSLSNAAAFHRWLQLYKHPNTWTVYSTGLNSEMRVDFRMAPIHVESQVIPSYGLGPATILHSATRADGTVATLRSDEPYRPGTYKPVLENPNIRPEGDGTVPAPSARGLFPGESHRFSSVNDSYGSKHQFAITGGTHDGMCNDAGTVNLLSGILPHIIENHV